MPLVSVITPAYNAEKYIGATIESILAQTFADWELLVTDDASTDGTRQIVRRYASENSRIRLICSPVRSGAAAARNLAMEQAEGRYIAFCDSDDTWAPEKLERQLKLMREQGCGLCYSSYYRCTEDGTPYRLVKCRPVTTYRQICRFNSIPCLTGIYDTAITGRLTVPPLRKRQDWALWIKVLQKCGTALGLPEPLAYYRVREDSLSSGTRSCVEFNIKVLTDVLGYSKARAWLHYIFVTLPHKI